MNVNMDMEPWQRINPCGLSLPVTQIKNLVAACPELEQVEQTLVQRLASNLRYNDILLKDEFPLGIS